ncbi:MAG TPA: long-chain fatty acid--CoA ligase [Candidatus Sumerlaeota bacterium]|nr:long-chain fatty acid--CoA ligase [Candidatus Sumerlaeota bacterium]HPS01702.1 long-chain fatty acid--CoA ligase [Candidatus Sumerlaeota bacterium]
MNVLEILHHSAEQWPDHVALIHGTDRIEYRRLFTAAYRLRDRLVALGLRPGQAVAVVGGNTPVFIATAFAVAGAGAVAVLQPHTQTDVEFRETLGAFPIHAVVSDGVRAAFPLGLEAQPLDPEGFSGEVWFAWTKPVPERLFAPSVPEAAFARFTSGTTGQPKCAVLTHANIGDRLRAANRGLGITPAETVLWLLPMAFHFFVSITLYLAYGATIVLTENPSSREILERVKRHAARILYAAPRHYRRLAEESETGIEAPLASLRLAISTASGLPARVARAFYERYGVPVSQAYGIIEAGLPMLNTAHALEQPEAVGSPLPGWEVRLLDAEGKPVADGAVGELLLRGPGLFAGYLQGETFRTGLTPDGWLPTGDLARRTAPACYRILGRAHAAIHIEGRTLFPELLEAALESHPAVDQARVTVAPAGDGLHADLVAQAGFPRPSLDELRACGRDVEGMEALQAVAWVEALEETASGKIRRWNKEV